LQPPRPGGDDSEVLVVQTPGAQIGQRGEQLIVSVKGEDERKIPGQQVRAIHCYGAIQLTAQAVGTCLELGIDVSYFSLAGRFLGLLRGLPASGVDARRGQSIGSSGAAVVALRSRRSFGVSRFCHAMIYISDPSGGGLPPQALIPTRRYSVLPYTTVNINAPRNARNVFAASPLPCTSAFL